MIKKAFASLLLVVMLLGTSAHAQSIQPRFTHISQCHVGLYISGGVADVVGGGTAMYNDTYSTAAVTLFRRPITGGSWSGYHMWRDYSTGTHWAGVIDTISVESGYEYQVYLCFYVSDVDGNILEAFGAYSDIQVYP